MQPIMCASRSDSFGSQRLGLSGRALRVCTSCHDVRTSRTSTQNDRTTSSWTCVRMQMIDLLRLTTSLPFSTPLHHHGPPPYVAPTHESTLRHSPRYISHANTPPTSTWNGFMRDTHSQQLFLKHPRRIQLRAKMGKPVAGRKTPVISNTIRQNKRKKSLIV